MVPLSTLVEHEPHAGPRVYQPLQPVPLRRTDRPTRAGYSSAQALTALEEVADKACRRHELRLGEHVLPGEGGRRHRRVVFLMALVFVFLILAAQYESWSLPRQRHAGYADRRVRRDRRFVDCAAVQRKLREQRVRPDRAGHADWHGGEECHPDRRVRQRRKCESGKTRYRQQWRRRSLDSDLS